MIETMMIVLANRPKNSGRSNCSKTSNTFTMMSYL